MVRLNYNLDDIPDIPVVPAGRYRARLMKVVKMQSTTDNPMLKWTWKIKGGKNDGMQISSFTSLLENALSGLKQHLIAFKLKGKVSSHTDKLIGRMALIIVGKRKGVTKLGEKVEFSNILGVLPIDTKLKPEPEPKKKARRIVEDEEEEEEEGEDEDDDEDEDGDEDDDDEEEEDEDSVEAQWEELSKGARRKTCEEAELPPKLALKDWGELSAKQQKALEECLTEGEDEEDEEDD